MRLQNQFKTGIDIAKYTASIMRRIWMNMIKIHQLYSIIRLLAWFHRTTKLISIKKHFGTNNKKYLYLSGWMIAALRSEFGPYRSIYA